MGSAKISPTSYAPYSPSKIRAYQGCPRKFKFTYIDKLPNRWEPSIPLDRGKLLHLFLELNGDMAQVKKHKEFKEIMTRGLVTKEILKETLQTYKEFVSSDLGKKVLNKEVVYTELPIAYDKDIKITEYSNANNDVYIRGYIDSVRVIEKPQEDILWCIDWKSGKYVQEESQQYDQVLYYSLGLFDLIPYDKIAISFVYIEHNKANTKIVHRSEIEDYKKALYNNINKIETDITFEKNETHLCSWCNFEGVCLHNEAPEIEISEDEIPF